jgi:hypothetical protein
MHLLSHASRTPYKKVIIWYIALLRGKGAASRQVLAAAGSLRNLTLRLVLEVAVVDLLVILSLLRKHQVSALSLKAVMTSRHTLDVFFTLSRDSRACAYFVHFSPTCERS